VACFGKWIIPEGYVPIARDLGVDPSTVKAALLTRGVELRSSREAMKSWARIKQASGQWPDRIRRRDVTEELLRSLLIDKQMSVYTVARSLQMDPTSIYDRVHKYGIQLTGFMPVEDTDVERRVEEVLNELGLKYQKQFKIWWEPKKKGQRNRTLDFVLLDRKLGIECNGCYWHSCAECGYKVDKKWKREALQRDHTKRRLMEEDGWNLLVVWEHERDVRSLIIQALTAVPVLVDNRHLEMGERAPSDSRRASPLLAQLTPERLRELYIVQKLSTNTIAAQHRCSTGTVWNRLRRAGIATRSHEEATPKQDFSDVADEVVRRYTAGESINDLIADPRLPSEVGIRRILAAAGVEPRSKSEAMIESWKRRA